MIRPATMSRSAVRAAVLLEVLLALALFVAASAIMTVALNASISSLDRQRLGMHAANLAASVLAEIQLGIRPMASSSRKPLEAPFQDWTWELDVAPAEGPGGEATGLSRVEVTIRHQTQGVSQHLAQNLRSAKGGLTNGVATPAEP
jgi:type II secretory pathway pseudopilin PulG